MSNTFEDDDDDDYYYNNQDYYRIDSVVTVNNRDVLLRYGG